MIALGLSVAAGAPASASPPSVDEAGQRFVPDVVDAFHKLSRRGEPLAAQRTLGHQATDCKHQEGMARKDAADGTPYMFVSKSGKDPGGLASHQRRTDALQPLPAGRVAARGPTAHRVW